jgi:UDP-glucose 4-epimerase
MDAVRDYIHVVRFYEPSVTRCNDYYIKESWKETFNCVPVPEVSSGLEVIRIWKKYEKKVTV